MQDLEFLLNALLKMGWKPWNRTIEKIRPGGEYKIFLDYSSDDIKNREYYKDYRQLASRESGLWRFVVENKLYKKTNIVYEKHFGIGEYKNFHDVHYQYWLLESALVPEEELVEFLLENIKVEGGLQC